MDAKGSMALAIVAVLLAMIVLGVFLVNVAMRDCNGNQDCPANAYCGSDYECHEFPQQIVLKQSNLWPALILGICLIIAAYIFRRGNFAKKADNL